MCSVVWQVLRVCVVLNSTAQCLVSLELHKKICLCDKITLTGLDDDAAWGTDTRLSVEMSLLTQAGLRSSWWL